MNVPRHLSYVLQKFVAAGGNFIRASLPAKGALSGSLQVVEDLVRSRGLDYQIHGFVNATGLGARELLPDEKLFSTRGQTLVVRGEATAARTFEGISSIRYVIPRPYSGTSILGGTKQAYDSSTEVDDQTTKEILEGCKALAPELLDTNGEFEVLKVNVGLRPSREGGARLEKEVVGEKWVVHAYGHSGAGYQNSVGVARKVVGLVGLEQMLEL